MKSQWGIRLPSGEYLDTPADFAIQFEFNSQVFSTGDTSVLPGSFSFPITVSLTPKMRQQLSHPDRIDNTQYFKSISGILVCIDGNPLFTGKLNIDKSQGGKIALSIIVNPLSDFKKTDLDKLDLGGSRTLAPAASWPDLMLETAQNPEDYDFVFFPVLGGEIEFRSTSNIGESDPWFYQNNFNISTEEFTTDSGIYSPFVKLKYLLDRIFLNLGEDYTFQNAWQVGLELQRLYVYNNVDLRQFNTAGTAPELPTAFNLNRHVPKIKSTDFLKRLLAQSCLGMFTNHFKRTFRLVPLSTVLAAAAKHNWTEYAFVDPSLESPEDFPKNFNYKNVFSTPPGVIAPHNAEQFDTVEDYLVGSPTEQYVFIRSINQLLDRDHENGVGINVHVWKLHHGQFNDEQSETFDAGMDGLFCNNGLFYPTYESTSYLSRWSETTTGAGTDWIRDDVDMPCALMFYRGIQSYDTGYNPVPVACNQVENDVQGGGVRVKIIDGATDPDAEYSLNWEGDHGLYNKAWKQWHTMLTQGKHVTQTFIISVTTLREFSFEDKVRVGNMDFFLKKMRIQKLLADGKVQIETSMVSVI